MVMLMHDEVTPMAVFIALVQTSEVLDAQSRATFNASGTGKMLREVGKMIPDPGLAGFDGS